MTYARMPLNTPAPHDALVNAVLEPFLYEVNRTLKLHAETPDADVEMILAGENLRRTIALIAGEDILNFTEFNAELDRARRVAAGRAGAGAVLDLYATDRLTTELRALPQGAERDARFLGAVLAVEPLGRTARLHLHAAYVKYMAYTR